MTAFVQFEQVSKSYSGNKVLDDISFTLERGKIIGLLGPNGSGKTTIMKLMNGLIKPNSGKILINGMEPGVASKQVISYLPDRNYLNNWMRIEDTLSLFQDFYADFDRQKAEEMLRNLDIEPKMQLKTLSKGTLEKVQLVLIMSRKAQLYILDEPIAGVDPAARDYILETILKNYNEDSTIFLSTHLITDVEKIFDQVLFLKKGKVRLQGDVDELRDKYHQSIYSLSRRL